MQPDLSGIFRVKITAKNIVLGSPGAQRRVISTMRCLFLRKHATLLNQTVTF